MKKLAEIVICCLIALGIGAGCKTEGGGGDPTPVPTEVVPVGTAVPVPTEAPTPKPVEPCVLHAQVGKEKVYKGDCAASSTCRDGRDGFWYGSDCQQAAQ